ncbi:hypothetical protein F5887DRAFT_1076579 [Amanita rubescens]|nr:hypothetical protein F5887DRAFT_1076579 [Amanita rubescens]
MNTTHKGSELQELVNTISLIRLTNYAIDKLYMEACFFICLPPPLLQWHKSAKWSFPKIAYLYLRYYALVYLATLSAVNTRLSLSVESDPAMLNLDILMLVKVPPLLHLVDNRFLTTTRGGPVIFANISSVILIMRLHALYNRNHKVLIFLVVSLVGQVVASFYTTIRSAIVAIAHIVPPVPGIPWPGCSLSPMDTSYDLVSWLSTLIVTSTSESSPILVTILIIKAIYFLMTLWSFLKSTRGLRRFRLNYRRIRHVSPIFVALIWHGTVHYFMIMATVFVGMMLAVVVRGPLVMLCSPIPIAVFSFATSRLILNLRMSAAHHIGQAATWQETLSMRMPPLESDTDLEIERCVGHAENDENGDVSARLSL